MLKLIELGDGLQVYALSVMEARFMYDEIFKEDCYGVDLPEQPLVIDVGANIGMFAIFIKQRYPDAEVLSFEPMPESASLLRRNIALHQLDRVTVHELALGSEAERNVSFAFYPMLPGHSTRYPETKVLPMTQMAADVEPKVVEQMYRAREVNARVDRLATFLPPDRRVDLLKVDVEGAEADVLLGIDTHQWPQIQRAILEVADIDGQLAVVCDILRDNGLTPAVRQAPLTEAENVTYMVHATRG